MKKVTVESRVALLALYPILSQWRDHSKRSKILTRKLMDRICLRWQLSHQATRS